MCEPLACQNSFQNLVFTTKADHTMKQLTLTEKELEISWTSRSARGVTNNRRNFRTSSHLLGRTSGRCADRRFLSEKERNLSI